MIEKLTAIFRQKFGYAPAHIARAPGRVNLLGEHVDYNDGFVLPAAIDRATYIVFSPSETDHTTLWAVDFNEQASFSPRMLSAKTQLDGLPLPDWARYPAGVMWALAEAGLSTPAMSAVFASTVPRGSGLSSSASVEMAFAIAWQSLGGWMRSPMELALLSQKAENQYVGVNCGIMDQFASACGVKNKILWLDCRTLEYRALPLPENVVLVVADTTIRRTLTGGEYNRRRTACEEAVNILKNDLPGIKALRDVNLETFDHFSSKLPAEVEQRARHVVAEIERTQRAVELLELGEAAGVGHLINECHASLRDLYEVSIPELDTMARLAQSLPGCYGARLTGAGFGGCTINLVDQGNADDFMHMLEVGYEAETGHHPEIYICRASHGAKLL